MTDAERQFAATLQALRKAAGMPTYAVLVRHAHENGADVSLSTVGGWFVGTHLPGERYTKYLLESLIPELRRRAGGGPKVNVFAALLRAARAGRGARSGRPAKDRGEKVGPVTLPPDEERFVGRVELVDELLDHLVSVDPDADALPVTVVSAVAGMGGVGKTALAVHVAHRALARHCFPGGVLFEDLRGYSPEESVSAGLVAARLLRAFGISARSIPVDEADRLTAWRAALAAEHRAVLIVLDNADHAGQVSNLIPGPPHRVLITSRTMLSALRARTFVVPVFGPEEALRFVDTALRTARPDDDRVASGRAEALRLVTLCGHLPLALRIGVALLRDEPDRTVSALTADLADARTRLEQLGYPDTDAEGRPLAVRAAFDLSYQRLSPEVARAFRLLAAVPGVDSSTEAAAVMFGLSQAHARPLLGRLARMHLIDPRPPERWVLHDLVRLYAEWRGEEQAATDHPTAALDRLYQHYIDRLAEVSAWLRSSRAGSEHRFGSYPDPLTWCDAESSTMIAAVGTAHAADRHSTALNLAGGLSEYVEFRHRLDDALTVGRTALDAAGHLGPAEQCRALSQLGNANRIANRFTEAAAHLERARALSSGETVDTGAILHNLGLVYFRLRRYAEAERCHARDFEICRRAGDRWGRVEAMIAWADALRMLDRVPDAIGLLNQAILFGEQMNSPAHTAAARTNLAVACLENLPGHRAGFVIWQLCSALRIERDRDDRPSMANVFRNLGAAYMHRDPVCHASSAVWWWQRAAEAYRDLGDTSVSTDIESLWQEVPATPPSHEQCMYEGKDSDTQQWVRSWLDDLPHAVLRGDDDRLTEVVFLGDRMARSAEPGSTIPEEIRARNPHGLMLGLKPEDTTTDGPPPLSAATTETVAGLTGRTGHDLATAVGTAVDLLTTDFATCETRPFAEASVPQLVAAVTDTWSAAEACLPDLDQDTASRLLRLRSVMMNVLTSAGRGRDAVTLGEALLADCKALLGEQHRETWRARNNLGGACMAIGQPERSCALHAENRTVTLDGPDDPDVLITRHNLGHAHMVAGRPKSAVDILRPLLADRIRVLGQDAPAVGDTQLWLGLALADRGRVAEAIHLVEEARDNYRNRQPPSPELPQLLLALAGLYRRAGRTSSAWPDSANDQP